jgi:type IV secretion system protein VirB10
MKETLLVKRPVVAKVARPTGVAGPAGALALLGAGVFFWLSEARASIEASQSSLPPLQASTTPAPAEAPPASQAPPATTSAAQSFIPNSGPVTLTATQPQPQQSVAPFTGFQPQRPPPSPPAADSQRERLRAPSLVVDLAQADVPRPPGPARNGSGATVPPGTATGPAADRNLSDTERFSARVGSEEIEVARAQQMGGLDRLVPQGAIIGAVMETALNSDLPGYARALTQRDVYSFDGTAVLIPSGSRLIGQYKSGVAQGASRVFVLWTRLIRPDGVSIDLASPAVDDLGRGGLGGKVNRHFFQRFGGAILTSVLTGGINAAAAALAGGSTIIVGSAGQAASLAGQAAQGEEIPPTITTRQGATVRIFVARDLDFSQVGPAR